MARRKGKTDARDKIDLGKHQFVGRRFIRLLEEQLRQLHDSDTHGNRVLHFDHVVVAHLLSFFNPIVDSLRTIEGVFDQPRIRQRYKLPRVPRSTLADAQQLFDPTLLQPILDHLIRQVGNLPHDTRLDKLTRQIVAVDATFFEVASRIAWALPRNNTSARGSVQLCLHYDVLHGAPLGFSLLDGQSSEIHELPPRITAGKLYLLDRAYQSYANLNDIVAADSDFVVRLRKSANFNPDDVLPLTAEDRLAGVQHDWIVRPTDRHYSFSQPTRLVEIFVPDESNPVRLLTNRCDVPAAVIGLLYRYRWQIELFFRWLKCVVQLQRFTSESTNGISIQLYVAMIGTLLIALEAGARPSKYDLVQMSLVVNGMVTLEEGKQVADKRRAERARAAAWQKQYNARKKTAR